MPRHDENERRRRGAPGDALPRRQGPDIPADVVDVGAAYEVLVDLPGVLRPSIRVDVEDGVATVSAERPLHEPNSRGAVGSRWRGKARRAVRLPDGVSGLGMTSSYLDGLLRLRFPKDPRGGGAGGR